VPSQFLEFLQEGARLVHLESVRLNWACPSCDFIDDKLGEVVRRSALKRDVRNTELVHSVLNRWRVHCLARCVVKLLDNLCGCAFRKKKSVPGHDVEVG
jgi:hypothetical protein